MLETLPELALAQALGPWPATVSSLHSCIELRNKTAAPKTACNSLLQALTFFKDLGEASPEAQLITSPSLDNALA